MTKIYVYNNIQGGISKYRLLDPHLYLQNYHNEYEVFFKKTFDDVNTINPNIMFFHSSAIISKFDILEQRILLNQRMGIKNVIDIDDYWKVNPENSVFKRSIREKWSDKITSIIKRCDLVITPNELIYKKLKQFYKGKIQIIKNCLNYNEQQVIKGQNKIITDYTKIGYATGSSHLKDIQLLRNINVKNSQFVLAGYDDRIVNSNGKVEHSRENTIWEKYEKILTNNYSKISKEYKNHLYNGLKNMEYKNIDKEIYRRVWSKPINTYLTSYQYFDIALAPLVNNSFNLMKSELKIIEAAMTKTPIICSNIDTYNKIIKDGKNGFLVDEKKSHKDFNKKIKYLINNPSLKEDITEKLYEDVNKEFNYNYNSLLRHESYQDIINK